MGLVDRRNVKPSDKRVSVAKVKKVLRLCRQGYFDLNMGQFHEKLKESTTSNGATPSCRKRSKGAGLVGARTQTAQASQAAGAASMPGMRLQIDGNIHQ